MEKIGWTDRVRNDVLQRVKKEMNILQTVRRRNANWIVHTFRTNCIPKQVIDGKREGRIQVREDEEEDISSNCMALR